MDSAFICKYILGSFFVVCQLPTGLSQQLLTITNNKTTLTRSYMLNLCTRPRFQKFTTSFSNTIQSQREN